MRRLEEHRRVHYRLRRAREVGLQRFPQVPQDKEERVLQLLEGVEGVRGQVFE